MPIYGNKNTVGNCALGEICQLLRLNYSSTELAIGHNVASTAEVDAFMEQAKNAGAVIVKPAQTIFWGGYAGYFQDPDHHLWEVVWNPQLLPGD